MMKRIAGTGADRAPDDYDPRYKGYQGDRPAQPQHYPSLPAQKAPATHFNQAPGGGQTQQVRGALWWGFLLDQCCCSCVCVCVCVCERTSE